MFLFSSRRRHTRCALVTGVQTCALPITVAREHRQREQAPEGGVAEAFRVGAVDKAENREKRERQAREDIDEAERDHSLASCPIAFFAMRISMRRRRRTWRMKAGATGGQARREEGKRAEWGKRDRERGN